MTTIHSKDLQNRHNALLRTTVPRDNVRERKIRFYPIQWQSEFLHTTYVLEHSTSSISVTPNDVVIRVTEFVSRVSASFFSSIFFRRKQIVLPLVFYQIPFDHRRPTNTIITRRPGAYRNINSPRSSQRHDTMARAHDAYYSKMTRSPSADTITAFETFVHKCLFAVSVVIVMYIS